MIYYATSRLLKESTKRHPKLVDLVHDLDLEAEKVGWQKVVTSSIYRTIAENRAAGAKTIVHVTVPHRAQDIDTKAVNTSLVSLVVDRLNAAWCYDHTRPSLPVAFARPHGTGPHIHLQVHPNTRRRA